MASYAQVIRSFADRDTGRLWDRKPVRRFPPDLRRVMLRKLSHVDAALQLEDLRLPPDNRLEKLRGNRAGQHRSGERDRLGARLESEVEMFRAAS